MSAAAAPPITRPHAQVHLGVFFQGVNHHTVWSDAESGSQIDPISFERVAHTAERGLFDAFFLGEGLRLRESNGHLQDLDVVGRPDAITQLAALAATTTHLGLVATQNATYNEPTDLARRLASLDVLSGGRAAWNVVTTDNAWTGANFRRGGYLDHADRYVRAAEVVRTAQALWDSWGEDGLATSTHERHWAREHTIAEVSQRGSTLQVRARATAARSPQQHPVLFQAGDSDAGRDFAAHHAEVIYSAHGSDLADALAFATDIRARTAAAGRPADDVKILPSAYVVLAETTAQAEEKHRWLKRAQVSGATALSILGQVLGRDISHLDPDAPLPNWDARDGEIDGTRGAARSGASRRELVQRWRSRAEAEGLTIRELVIAQETRRGFVGTPADVAQEVIRFVRTGAVDGFNISPWIVPDGLDDVVDLLVPELQERGAYRSRYTGTTLREHLGLRPPLTRRAGARQTAGHGS